MDISKVLNNEYLIGVLVIFCVIYASQYRPNLPNWIVKLFKNDIFRVVYLSLLLMIPFEKSPHVALIVALVFVITLHYINSQENYENFNLLESYKNSSKSNQSSFNDNLSNYTLETSSSY